MIIDKFTKFCLSIIAISLLTIAVNDIIPTVQASHHSSNIAVCHAAEKRCADVVSSGYGDALLVKIVN